MAKLQGRSINEIGMLISVKFCSFCSYNRTLVSAEENPSRYHLVNDDPYRIFFQGGRFGYLQEEDKGFVEF